MTAPLRATFLTVVPSPYTRDLFAAMRHDGRVLPRVLYAAMRMPGFDWGDQQLHAWETVLAPPAGRRMPNPGLAAALAAEPADAYVVCGYGSTTNQIAMRWLRRRRMPWVFFGERPEMRRRGPLGRFLREIAMRPAVRWPDGIAAAGALAVEAYRRRCPPGTPIANLPYFSDLGPFRRRPASPGSVTDRFRILYCGQLIERKGVDLLFDAFCRVARNHPQAELVLVGDGPMRETLRASLPAELAGRVRFAGFRSVEELPGFFSEADVLVLPSRHDGWGVVVNQALGAGLPVIASEAVGAALDLVADDENGFLVTTGDADSLAAALERLAGDSTLCRRLGEGSRAASERADLAAGVQGWFELLMQVVESSNAKPSLESLPATAEP